MTHFIKEVKPTLTYPPSNFNGGLAETMISFPMKQAIIVWRRPLALAQLKQS